MTGSARRFPLWTPGSWDVGNGGFVGSIKREIARQNIAMRTVAMAMEARYSHQGGRGGSCWGWPPSCGPTWLGLVGWAGLAAAGTIMRTSPGRVAFRFLMKKQALPHPPSPKSVQIRHIPQLRWPATVRLNAMIWGRNTASRRMVFRDEANATEGRGARRIVFTMMRAQQRGGRVPIL